MSEPLESALAPVIGRLYHRLPSYTLEQVDAAWLAFARSAHGQVILDLWMVRVVLAQKPDMRAVGKEDLVIEVLDAIQQAEHRTQQAVRQG